MTRARWKTSAWRRLPPEACWRSNGPRSYPPYLPMRSRSESATATATSGLFRSIVRSFLRNRHVVHVALAHAGRGNANQPRVALQRRDVLAAAIAHAGPQTTDELIDEPRDAAFVRHAALDAFRHELVGAAGRVQIEFVLEIPIAAATAHGADRPHAAVLLETAALIQNQLARALVGPGEEIADHHRARADRDCLRHTARKADAAVGDDRYVMRGGGARTLHHGGDHRHADAGDHTRCADRSG